MPSDTTATTGKESHAPPTPFFMGSPELEGLANSRLWYLVSLDDAARTAGKVGRLRCLYCGEATDLEAWRLPWRCCSCGSEERK